jgi:F-type H+-transporting ATPase subunit a
MFATILLVLALLAPAQQQQPGMPVQVQEGIPTAPAAHPPEGGDDIMHHVLDERVLKVPFMGYLKLPPANSWQVGPVDLTPTKYVVWLWITGLLTILLILPAAQAVKRRREAGEATGGKHYNAIEAMVLFFRDQIVMPNIGHGGERFVPFIASLFFFIAISNLLGLIPYGASATTAISVTATLALMSLVAIEYAGIRALGWGYLNTIFYWNKNLPPVLREVLFVILSIVEMLGKLAKPFALAIRLMANMTAGKIVIYSLLGLIFVFGSWWVVAGPVLMTVALTFLKIFVAFLQAYIFALLTSVFIGLIMHAHH